MVVLPWVQQCEYDHRITARAPVLEHFDCSHLRYEDHKRRGRENVVYENEKGKKRREKPHGNEKNESKNNNKNERLYRDILVLHQNMYRHQQQISRRCLFLIKAIYNAREQGREIFLLE